MNAHSLPVTRRDIYNPSGTNDQARRKFFSSDVAGKKEDRIRDYSELNQIICPGLCNLIYPAILHENYDLLAKRRRNRFIIPLQLSQECENELMPCSDLSIEIPINGIFRTNNILAYFADTRFFLIPEEVHILPGSIYLKHDYEQAHKYTPER